MSETSERLQEAAVYAFDKSKFGVSVYLELCAPCEGLRIRVSDRFLRRVEHVVSWDQIEFANTNILIPSIDRAVAAVLTVDK